MTALALLLLTPATLWTVQAVVRARAGLPTRWRIDFTDGPPGLRVTGRIATQAALAAIIAAYPQLRGERILDYYAALLPENRSALQFLHGAAASTLFLCALFGVWLATDRLVIDPHHSPAKTRRRMLLLIPTALFGAGVEELIFRGVLLADLLRGPLSHATAVLLAAIVFAAAHYVRPAKRKWTFPGHVLLGVLLCVAYLQTRTLWLPVGLHAGGIFMIMGVRPFVRYRGPAWLTGASIFPFAGVVGMAGLLILTGFVVTHYGPR